MRHYDVKNAYINRILSETIYIYMRQPEGYEVMDKRDWILKLKKSLYGLKQSACGIDV